MSHNFTIFSNNCSNVLFFGYETSIIENLLNANSNLNVTCIVYEEVSSVEHERLTVHHIPVDSLTLFFDNTYLHAFDGMIWCGDIRPHQYVNDTISALKYLRDRCYCVFMKSQHLNVNSWINILNNTHIFKPCNLSLTSSAERFLTFTRPRYAICTMAKGDQYKDKVKNCITSKYKYCQYYKYTLITEEDFVIENRPHPAWLKTPLLCKYLPEYDFIFWIDGDAMIVNLNVCLDIFFLFLPKTHLNLISCDHEEINSGVMLLKNCPETLMTLKALPSMREDLMHFMCFEQKPLIEIVRLKFIPNLFFEIPSGKQQVWNAYEKRTFQDPNGFNENDFIVHFAGYNILQRKEFNMKEADEEHGKLIGHKPLPFERYIKIFS